MERAEEYIGSMLHVYCLNRREFEPNQMSITPSGDMIDDKGRVHSAKRHLPFVLYGTAYEAIAIAEDNMKQKAYEALSSVLESWVHGGDADCILAEFEEKLNNV